MPPRIANRPGRFDRVTYVGAPPYAVQMEYFRRLVDRLGEHHPDAPRELADALDGLPISMAHLREAFIAHVLMGIHPDEVRRRFEEMAKDGAGGEAPAPSDVEKDDCYACGGPLDSDDQCTDEGCIECPDYDPEDE
jgi:hypothetical protein